MRLIDADALKKALKNGCENCLDANTNWCERCCPHNDFEDLIDNAPTVELKRVKNELNNELNELKSERPQKEIGSFECNGKCDSCELGVPIDGQYYDDGTPIHECGYKSGGDT